MSSIRCSTLQHLRNKKLLQEVLFIYSFVHQLWKLLFDNYHPDLSRDELQYVGNELIRIAEKDFNELSDDIILNSISLFSMVDEGGERIKKISNSHKKKKYYIYGLETCITHFNFNFLSEIPFYVLIVPEDRILLENVIEGDKKSILSWINKVF